MQFARYTNIHRSASIGYLCKVGKSVDHYIQSYNFSFPYLLFGLNHWPAGNSHTLPLFRSKPTEQTSGGYHTRLTRYSSVSACSVAYLNHTPLHPCYAIHRFCPTPLPILPYIILQVLDPPVLFPQLTPKHRPTTHPKLLSGLCPAFTTAISDKHGSSNVDNTLPDVLKPNRPPLTRYVLHLPLSPCSQPPSFSPYPPVDCRLK